MVNKFIIYAHVYAHRIYNNFSTKEKIRLKKRIFHVSAGKLSGAIQLSDYFRH